MRETKVASVTASTCTNPLKGVSTERADAMRFQYFEIRPCIEREGIVLSFSTVEGPDVFRKLHPQCCDNVFWTIYGISTENDAVAIGHFKTKEAAFAVMAAILAPLIDVRDVLHAVYSSRATNKNRKNAIIHAMLILEDFFNQCSNEERL